jgi:hypothetical protein
VSLLASLLPLLSQATRAPATIIMKNNFFILVLEV